MLHVLDINSKVNLVTFSVLVDVQTKSVRLDVYLLYHHMQLHRVDLSNH